MRVIWKQDVILSVAQILIRLGKNDIEGTSRALKEAQRDFDSWVESRPEKNLPITERHEPTDFDFSPEQLVAVADNVVAQLKERGHFDSVTLPQPEDIDIILPALRTVGAVSDEVVERAKTILTSRNLATKAKKIR